MLFAILVGASAAQGQTGVPNGSLPAGAYRVPQSATKNLTPAEEGMIKRAASEAMIDPTSPLFKLGPQIVASGRYCGMINGKNRFGAYVGFKTFGADITRNAQGRITSLSNVQIITRNMDSAMQEMALGCLNDGYPMSASF